jgi:hypothetical protein
MMVLFHCAQNIEPVRPLKGTRKKGGCTAANATGKTEKSKTPTEIRPRNSRATVAATDEQPKRGRSFRMMVLFYFCGRY